MTADRQIASVSITAPSPPWEADPTKAYNPDDATGFIRLSGLRLKVVAKLQRKVKK